MIATSEKNCYLCYGQVAVDAPSLKFEDCWIQVKDFWLEISKKVGQPSNYVIPLYLSELRGANQMTQRQNSIYIETKENAGRIKIYLASTNRLDIIQLFHAITAGSEMMQTMLAQKQIDKQCTIDVERPSGIFGLGKSHLKMKMNQQGLTIAGDKTGDTCFIHDQIVSITAKQGDSMASTKLVIITDDGEMTKSEFICQNHNALLNVISCFISNTDGRGTEKEATIEVNSQE